jgi:RNase P/RNase MRP subunit p29
MILVREMVIKRYIKHGNMIKCIESTGHLVGAEGKIIKETKTMYWVNFIKPSGYRQETSVRKDSIVENV